MTVMIVGVNYVHMYTDTFIAVKTIYYVFT